MNTIIFTGGGSGGHAIPGLLVMRSLLTTPTNPKSQWQCHYLGRPTGLEKNLVHQLVAELATHENTIHYVPIPAGKLHRRLTIKQAREFTLFLLGLARSFLFLARKKTLSKKQLVFATGGYVSLPVVLAARLLGYTIWLHEQTSRAGLANRIASKLSQKIFISFEASRTCFPPRKVFYSGYPLRREFEQTEPNKNIRFMGSNLSRVNKPILLFCGGGNGSATINKLVEQYLFLLVSKYVVLHQCGGDFLERKAPQDPNYFPFGFASQLPELMKLSRLVVSRSGAGIVSECIALKKPSIFIPLEHARGNEQLFNAKEALKTLPGRILLQRDLGRVHLVREIDFVLASAPSRTPKTSLREQRERSKQNAKNIITREIEQFYTSSV